MKRPLTIGLLCVIALLLYSNWRSAKQRDNEYRLRQEAIFLVKNSFWSCQPSVYLNGTNPVDAISLMRYRDAQNGRACVFLNDGRYGELWWSMIVEKKDKAHLEWQFREIGKYKW